MPKVITVPVARSSFMADVELVRDAEEIARERALSRSDVLRDWLRRGREDWRREQDRLTRLREADEQRTAV